MQRDNQRDDESLDDLEENDDEDDVATDALEASDQGRPWMPPIDPPVGPGGRAGVQVRAGFAPTSDDDVNEDAAAGNNRNAEEQRSDDEITARVKRLLRSDAATSTLRLEVETIDGVVYLRGEVDTLDDGDLAAEVASRVRGVEDVVDETWMRD
jgi:hyperosmotically inducible protein